MQVLPSSFAAMCFLKTDCFCFSLLMPSQLWQLRHSRESTDFILFHSFVASSMRLASNFSGVEISPVILPQTSRLACIFRQIFGPHSCGTWQSGHPARTPVRFE